MPTLLSKELLSEVLENKKVKEIYEIGSNPNVGDNTLLYSLQSFEDIQDINIFELADKCKKWAYKLDEWIIESGVTEEAYANLYGRYSCSDDEPIETFSEDTEVGAIFKAAQWILDNKDK